MFSNGSGFISFSRQYTFVWIIAEYPSSDKIFAEVELKEPLGLKLFFGIFEGSLPELEDGSYESKTY